MKNSACAAAPAADFLKKTHALNLRKAATASIIAEYMRIDSDCAALSKEMNFYASL